MRPDCVLRPVRESDHAQLARLVGTIADGLTTLPKDPDFLAHRINDSLRALDPRVHKPGGETYLFVLEDLANGALVGTSGLLSRVGGFDPFYTYRIRRRTQVYPPLGIRVELETLHLVRNHKGPSEICSLFLHPDYRAAGLGKLLSLARFLFIKAFPERFDEHIIAELRGYIGPDGRCPFWEAVGKKFFQKDYYTADILSGIGEKDFIEALMPKYPIYLSLLPEEARAVVGRVHPQTEPARRILLAEGFRETDEVDIFDAGPILRARRDQLKTWKRARTARVAEMAADAPRAPRLALLANRALEFRALLAEVAQAGDGILGVPPAALENLQIRAGDLVDWLELAG